MKNDLLNDIRTRREALLLSASAGVGLTLPEQLHALDSTKTAVHQQAGSCTTPQSAAAKTQYGKVRGYVSGGVYTFKGVPYGQDTAGENRAIWKAMLLTGRLLSTCLRVMRLTRSGAIPLCMRYMVTRLLSATDPWRRDWIFDQT